MVPECNKTLSDYQLCQVTERRLNHCFENHSPIVIREMVQSSDDEDRDGIWFTLVYLPFNHLMWLVTLKFYCNILPLYFGINRLA
jgi:hypothetical protein